MRRWFMAVGVIVAGGGILALGSCIRTIPAPPPPEAIDASPSQYTVPWDAKDTDLVCADTLPTIHWKPCLSVGQFRALVLDAKADN